MIRRWACVLGLVLALAGAARAGFGYSGGGRPGGGGRPQRLPTIALQWAPDLLQANLPASGAAVASARPALGGITPPVDPWDLPDDIDPLRPKPRPLRPGRGPGGLERGWSRFPRQHVDLSFRALNDVETYVASNKTNGALRGPGWGRAGGASMAARPSPDAPLPAPPRPSDPPSPCLCVGAGFVIEAVSSAVRVYSARTGAPLRAAVPLDVFMGQPGEAPSWPQRVRSPRHLPLPRTSRPRRPWPPLAPPAQTPR